jgi:hypothetical protein
MDIIANTSTATAIKTFFIFSPLNRLESPAVKGTLIHLLSLCGVLLLKYKSLPVRRESVPVKKAS